MAKKQLRISFSMLVISIFIITSAIYGQDQSSKIGNLKEKILTDKKVNSVIISTERETPSLISYSGKSNSYSKSEAANVLSGYLSVRQSVDQLQQVKQTSLPNNFEALEFQQFFRGIKVEHGIFKALIKDGNIILFNGAYYNIPVGYSTQPVLNKENALQKAKGMINAKKYATDFFKDEITKATDQRVKDALKKELESVSPKGELVIVKDFSSKGVAEMKLAYKFDIYATEPMSRHWVYVDASSGKILLMDPIIKHVNNPPTSLSTTVQTRYAGARTIKVKQINGNDPQNGLPLLSSHPTTEVYIPGSSTWVLIDDTRGKGIETYDLNGVGGVPFSIGAFYAQGKSFTDVDNNWSVFEHKRSDPLGNGIGEDGAFEAENDDIAWDAHWGAEMVYDYWLQKHNRKSYDGRDAMIKNFVHFGPAYDNAFWNGSAMTYGDGSGPDADGFKALTSLDVCAHEIGHGICTFTSNLVYERESGAMNEAFSDIWAACVEHFAITSVDATLVNRYRPFYIGEQIGASADQPLRRMDNPKMISDPDTYGGQFWRDPNCDPPDLLLNDYCGVHTNSGVLNKWFYLLTVGSQNGSGPDAIYARPDSDDGINDLGNTYNVTGLGFNVSEQIAFLTEILLSPTATYAEARELSLSAAIALSGDACSNTVRSVTNAWYAVGVGSAFSETCISTYGFIFQPGNIVNEGNAAAGCAGEYSYKVPVLLPANSTATVTVSGSAVSNVDYRLSSTTLSNTTTANRVVDLIVFIKSDAVIESNETINLSIAVSNTGSNPVNTSYVVTIAEDDITPVIGSGTISLIGGGTFDGQPDGYNSPAGWTKTVEVPGVNLWGVWGGKLMITGNVEGVQLQPGQYNNLSPTSTNVIAPQVDGRGLSNITLKFDFRVQGEVDVNGANPDAFGIFDYMTVVYSFDGVNFSDLRTLDEGFRAFCSLLPTEGTFERTLPAIFNNKVFYIGFKWYNDTNAGGPESVSVDNISLTGSPKLIENDLNHNSRENLYQGADAYFYSVQDGQIVGKIKNNSTKNFGCTNVFVERTGTSAFNLYQSRNALHKVADKVVRVETSFIYKASTTVSLYFTEQQLSALEAATNQSRTAFKVYHVNAAAYQLAANNNTNILTPAYTAIPGAGGIFTITFNDKANGSYALGCVVSVLGTQSSTGDIMMEQQAAEWRFGKIYPNPSDANFYMEMESPVQQKVYVEVVNISGQVVHRQTEIIRQGNNIMEMKMNKLIGGSYLVRFKDENGRQLHAQAIVRK